MKKLKIFTGVLLFCLTVSVAVFSIAGVLIGWSLEESLMLGIGSGTGCGVVNGFFAIYYY